MKKKQLFVTKVSVNGVEHLHSMTLGTAPRSRVEYAIQEKLMLFDREYGDYGFTRRSTNYINFWKWLQGDDDKLVTKSVIETI